MTSTSRSKHRYTRKHDSTMITDGGVVIKIYPDDNEGDRHQRFVINLNCDQTILIVHNIDLVERIPVLVYDYIEFCGEYEYNERGGLVHWTHHDPTGQHEPGWIRHAGAFYQ
jgi:Protein of unknown function (DUF3465)